MTGKQNVMSDARTKQTLEKHALSEGTKAKYGDISSDANGKDVRPGGHTVADAFMDHLTPFSYEYKNPQNEPSSKKDGGRYLGVMAQDVERAPEIGRQIVTDTPHGKVLEGGALMSGLAAATGRLHERTDAIEEAIAAMQTKKKGRA
jgi:general stress protein YciG